jgi:hypothetical protein
VENGNGNEATYMKKQGNKSGNLQPGFKILIHLELN